MELLNRPQKAGKGFDYSSLDKSLFPDPIAERAALWDCPPGAFEAMAAFDKVLIYQVMPVYMELDENGFWHLPGSKMFIPDDKLNNILRGHPRGILLSAGPEAKDQLLSNNVFLGDYVRFSRVTPFRMPIGLDPQNFEPHYLICCQAQDIVSSEDGIQRMKDGKVKMEWREVELPDGTKWKGHMFVGDGIPASPPMRGDFAVDAQVHTNG